MYKQFVTVCNNREWREYSFITYYLSITCATFLTLFSQDSVSSVAWKWINMGYVFRSIYPKLNTQSRFLKKICCRILSSGDSFWAICGYISLIINSSECYSRTKQFILFVATRHILILFNCHTSDNFFVDNAGSPDERGAVGHIIPLLFLKVRCQFIMLEICFCVILQSTRN